MPYSTNSDTFIPFMDDHLSVPSADVSLRAHVYWHVSTHFSPLHCFSVSVGQCIRAWAT